MTDRVDGLSRLGIDPAARATALTRVRRDERNKKESPDGRGQEQEPQEQDEAEDDGLPHIDVRV